MEQKKVTKQETIWGKWEIIHETNTCKVKQLTINQNHRLSYQKHLKRQESWTIIQGSALVTLDGVQHNLTYGETIVIPKESLHRIGNQNTEPLVIIEVQTGTYFGEDDIIRIEDDYGRC
tara:strand:- start:128 stop:484 length:357 start_codon:yes stop_codon:yes gene_type:complete